jgi:UDP-N-acetylglucosamine 2-epimerase
MFMTASAAFMAGVELVHLAAGDLSEKITTYDDFVRHIITLMSSKQVCFSDSSLSVVNDMFSVVNKECCAKAFNNPSFSLIDLDVIKNKVFDCKDIYDNIVDNNEKYILFLVHPENDVNNTKKIAGSIEEHCNFYVNKGYSLVFIFGNKDLNYELIYNKICNIKLEFTNMVFVYNNLEKDSFLNLVVNCGKFISNSSCLYYEIPKLIDMDNVIFLGDRNYKRNCGNVKFNDKKNVNDIFNFIW